MLRPRTRVLAVTAALAVVPCAAEPSFARGATLEAGRSVYVAAQGGRDDGPGTRRSPFATLARGVGAWRAARGSARFTIELLPGRHEPTVPLEIAGFPGASPLRIRAAAGGEAWISGGRAWPGSSLEFVSPGLWRLRVQETAGIPRGLRSLYVGGRRWMRARLPARGYFRPSAASPGARVEGASRLAPPSGTPVVAVGSRLAILHRWAVSRPRVVASSAGAATWSFAPATPAPRTFYEMDESTRFLVEPESVAPEGLAPGTWTADARDPGVLLLASAERPAGELVLPRLGTLLEIRGAAGVEIEDLELGETHEPEPAEGWIEQQGAAALGGGAVRIEDSREIAVRRCRIARTGGYGLAAGSGVRGLRVEDSRFEDLGAGGLRFGGEAARPTGQVRILRNRVRGGGRLFPAAAGILAQRADDVRIEDNEVADFYSTGISVGWHWGYGDELTHGIHVARNRVHHVGQGVLSDLGGIYLLGVRGPAEVVGNVVHDVEAEQDVNAWGIYLDEGSRDVVVRDNLVYRVGSGAFHVHYGRDLRVENNVFVDSGFAPLQRTRAEAHRTVSFARNLISWSSPVRAWGGDWTGGGFAAERNLYWNSGGHPVEFPDPAASPKGDARGRGARIDFDAWRASRPGLDRGSVIADPAFREPLLDDYRVDARAPGPRAIGFIPPAWRVPAEEPGWPGVAATYEGRSRFWREDED